MARRVGGGPSKQKDVKIHMGPSSELWKEKRQKVCASQKTACMKQRLPNLQASNEFLTRARLFRGERCAGPSYQHSALFWASTFPIAVLAAAGGGAGKDV
eukprot:1157707-Pelagomonas_calceolata.AAC.13